MTTHLRIGIDIRSLQAHDRFRGIGTYLSNLIQAISRMEDRHEYLLFAWADDDPLKLLRLSSQDKFRVIALRSKPSHATPSRLRNRLLRDLRVSHRDVDVFLQPDIAHGLPWGDVPKVAVVYDLIPLVFRDHYVTPPSLRQIRKLGARAHLWRTLQSWHYRWSVNQLGAATRLIAISLATKQDILRYFPHLHDRVTVIPLSCDPQFHPLLDVSPTLAKFGINRPFLLYVGGTDFRKNVLALLDAYDRVRGEGYDLQLALVGKEFEFKEDRTVPDVAIFRDRIAKSRFHRDIILAGFVEQMDLAGLYSAARAFVFPSLYEGFGLPILEAMACGCPVIAYRTSAIPEVAGTAAVLLDLSQDLASAIIGLIENENARAATIAAGFKQVGKFSWERTAADTLRVLQESTAISSP